MSKLSDFLSTNQIGTRRLMSASHRLESLRPEDRAIRAAKKKAKAGGEKPELAAKKPRSGRAVTPRLFTDAIAGKPVPGPGKSRLLRAVNAILAAKKKEAISLADLF